MGCSSLNTRYMTGSLWYYKAGTSAGAVTNPEACLTGVDTEAGVMDGRFVREDQVVVGLDSGGLVMVTLTKDEEGDKMTHYLECHTATVEHDDIMTGLDTWSRDNTVATCGMDNRLCVYNPALVMVQSYHPVHAGHVSGVACNQSSEHMVATCSKNVDMSVRVWDTRESNKPASTVARMTDHPPSSLAWSDDKTLVVGSVTGTLTRLDTRAGAGQCVLDSVSVGDRPVYRLRPAPSGKRMAVACDDVGVSVVSMEAGGMEVTQLASGHRDFVRGLAWSSDTSLWSAAWDSRVEEHTV